MQNLLIAKELDSLTTSLRYRSVHAPPPQGVAVETREHPVGILGQGVTEMCVSVVPIFPRFPSALFFFVKGTSVPGALPARHCSEEASGHLILRG